MRAEQNLMITYLFLLLLPKFQERKTHQGIINTCLSVASVMNVNMYTARKNV